MSKQDCPFCDRIAAGEYDDRSRRFDAVTFEPLNPVTKGHRLVVPVSHVTSALGHPSIAADVMAFATLTAARYDVAECNFITSAGPLASQTVMHLHLHIVPRTPADGLALPWSQDPKCGFCYCRLADAPECASDCAHRELSGHAGCASRPPFIQEEHGRYGVVS